MKTFSFLILFVTISFNSFAQSSFSYGIKLGVSFSNQIWEVTPNEITNHNYRIAITPRIYADVFNKSIFHLETEIGFVQKGITDKIPNASIFPYRSDGYHNANNYFNYLIFSLLAKFKYNSKGMSPYILCGPQIDFLVNKNIDAEMQSENVYDFYYYMNYDLSIGLGIEIDNFFHIPLLIEYRYERDLLKNEFPNNYPFIKNYSHNILLGMEI